MMKLHHVCIALMLLLLVAHVPRAHCMDLDEGDGRSSDPEETDEPTSAPTIESTESPAPATSAPHQAAATDAPPATYAPATYAPATYAPASATYAYAPASATYAPTSEPTTYVPPSPVNSVTEAETTRAPSLYTLKPMAKGFSKDFGFGANMDANFHNAGEHAKRVQLTSSDSISQGSGVLAMCAQGKGRYAALSFLCNLLLDGVKFGAEKLGIYNIRDDGHAISMDVDLRSWFPAFEGAWSLTIGASNSKKSDGYRLVIVAKDRQGVCFNWNKFVFGNFKFPNEWKWLEPFTSFMGMDKIGLCVFEIGLNVKPFGFRIQGITTGLIKIPFSFFTVIASKTDIVFAFAISVQADVNAFMRQFLGPMQFLLPAVSLQRFDFQICTGAAQLKRWPSIKFQDDRLNVLLPGIEVAAVVAFDGVTDNWFGFGKWAKKHWPGELRAGVFFREWKMGFEIMLPDTFLHPTFGIKGAQMSLYLDADFRNLFSLSIQQLVTKITQMSAEIAAVTAAAAGTVGVGALGYVKPILTFLGVKALPIGGTLKAGIFVDIAGVRVEWSMGMTLGAQIGASFAECKFEIGVQLQQVGMWKDFFGIKRLDVGNLIGEGQWTMVDPYIRVISVGGQFQLRPPPEFSNDPTIEGEIFTCIDTKDFWKKSYFVASLRNVILGPVLRNLGIPNTNKMPSWLMDFGFPDALSISMSLSDQITPSGSLVPAGIQIKGTMTGFKTRTKVELGISSSSFRMLLDLTQPLRLPAICEMLNLPQPQLPDWFAKTGFTDELVLGVDLNSFEVEFKAGFNLFGLVSRAELVVKPNGVGADVMVKVNAPVIDFGELHKKLSWVGVISRNGFEDSGPLVYVDVKSTGFSVHFEGFLKNLLFEGHAKFKIEGDSLIEASIKAKMVGLFVFEGGFTLGYDGSPTNINKIEFNGLIDTTTMREDLTTLIKFVETESGAAFRKLQEHAAQLRDKVAAATTKIGQQCNCGYRCDVDLGANLLEVGVSDEQLSEEERQTFDISYSSRVLIESEARMAELAEMSLEELADAGYLNLVEESAAMQQQAAEVATSMLTHGRLSSNHHRHARRLHMSHQQRMLLNGHQQRMFDEVSSSFLEVDAESEVESEVLAELTHDELSSELDAEYNVASFLELMDGHTMKEAAGWGGDFFRNIDRMRREAEERDRRNREEAARRWNQFVDGVRREAERRAHEIAHHANEISKRVRESAQRLNSEVKAGLDRAAQVGQNLMKRIDQETKKALEIGKRITKVVAKAASKALNTGCEGSKLVCVAACKTAEAGGKLLLAGIESSQKVLKFSEKVTAAALSIFSKIKEMGIDFKLSIRGRYQGADDDMIMLSAEIKLVNFRVPKFDMEIPLRAFTIEGILSVTFDRVLRYLVNLVPGLDKLVNVNDLSRKGQDFIRSLFAKRKHAKTVQQEKEKKQQKESKQRVIASGTASPAQRVPAAPGHVPISGPVVLDDSSIPSLPASWDRVDRKALLLKMGPRGTEGERRMSQLLDGARLVSAARLNVLQDSVEFCWKQSWDRSSRTGGVRFCPPEKEKSAGLCYNRCPASHPSPFVTTCGPRCPPGFRDDGLYCFKPAPYGRGSGYAIWNEAKCNRNEPTGCEKSGAMWYPKCRPGYRAIGCCICSPICPPGTTDIGISCMKVDTVQRGVGTPMVCAPNEEKIGLLCYPPCEESFHSVLHICWQDCPSTQPFGCLAACTKTQGGCASGIIDMVVSALEVAGNIAATVMTGGGAAAARVAIKGAIKAGIKAAGKAALKLAKSALRNSVKKMAKSMRKAFNMKSILKSAKNMAKDKLEETLQTVFEQVAELDAQKQAEADSVLAQAVDVIKSLDPTGISGMVDAFTKPKCKTDVQLRLPTVDDRRTVLEESGDSWKHHYGYAKLACSPLEKVAAHKNLFDAQDACETTPGCEAVGSVDRDAIWHFFPCATFAQTTNSQFTLIATRIKEVM